MNFCINLQFFSKQICQKQPKILNILQWNQTLASILIVLNFFIDFFSIDQITIFNNFKAFVISIFMMMIDIFFVLERKQHQTPVYSVALISVTQSIAHSSYRLNKIHRKSRQMSKTTKYKRFHIWNGIAAPVVAMHESSG